MPALIHTYHADVSALDRVYIVNGSPEKTERYRLLAEDYLNKIGKLNFSSLPQGCKVDYILFKRDLTESIFQANKDAKEYNAIKKWFPFADSIYSIEKIRRRGGALDAKNTALNFFTIIKDLAQLQTRLIAEKTLTIKDSRRAAIIINGIRAAAKNVFNFYNAYDPLFTWWVPDTYYKLDSALNTYAVVFKTTAEKNAPDKDSSGIVGYPDRQGGNYAAAWY